MGSEPLDVTGWNSPPVKVRHDVSVSTVVARQQAIISREGGVSEEVVSRELSPQSLVVLARLEVGDVGGRPGHMLSSVVRLMMMRWRGFMLSNNVVRVRI